MKAIQQYFNVVRCIMLNKVAVTSKSVDEKMCDHSLEIYWGAYNVLFFYFAGWFSFFLPSREP